MIAWRLQPGTLMRRYGLSHTQAERLIRHHTLQHWRRFGWIGAIACALLVVYAGSAFLDADLGGARPLLLGGGSIGTGLHLWLAQRAAYPAILQEAADLRDRQTGKALTTRDR